MQAEFALDVHNVFNNKVLKLFSGQDLFNFMENGDMPVVKASYQTPAGASAEWVELNQWTIYRPDLTPRELFFSLSVDY